MIWPTCPSRTFPERFAVQLNDTHPSIGVAELMRLLVDERQLDWDEAWAITVATFGYTNHTLLPEALETWPLPLFGESLPRHLEIIYEINRRFLDEVRAKFPGDEARLRRMSLIGEDSGKSVRMAHLATVGSHAINGVAALHSELLKDSVLKDFSELWPERFTNKTNGVTPRRFLALANPGLRELLDETIGDGWLTDLDQLRGLEAYADDAAFRGQWRAVKRANKARLADFVRSTTGVELNPDSLFDIQVKRIHEYKRQHLNVLHIVTLYHRLKQNPDLQIPPRAFIFGGKAAPGYFMAKRIIRLINAVGEMVNSDPDVNAVPEGRVRAGLQRAERAAHLSGRRPVRADLDRGQGGLGHRQHEVHDQRRADHRHARRRQRRDPRGGRRGELLPVRADRDGGRADQARRLPAVGLHRRQQRAGRRARSDRRRARSPTATPRCSARWSTTCATTTRSWSWPTTRRTSSARSR